MTDKLKIDYIPATELNGSETSDTTGIQPVEGGATPIDTLHLCEAGNG